MQGRFTNSLRTCFLLGWACLGLACVGGAAQAADRIVLRDLTIITNRTVKQLDVDGVLLDDGRLLNWGEIESGRVADQEAFNASLKKLGPPLLRLRQRLKTGDYPGLLESAEEVYPLYAERSSPTAYLVFQSLMWGRLANRERALSVAPYLRCYNYLVLNKGNVGDLPGKRRLDYDPRTGLSNELPPVWFDEDQAKKAIPDVLAAVRDMKVARPDGVYLYYASLLASAGSPAEAERFLGAVKGQSPVTRELQAIVRAQGEVIAGKQGSHLGKLASVVDDLSPNTRPLAMYWLGRFRLNEAKSPDEKRAASLELLYLPALYGEDQPELSAAAIYLVMQTLEDLKDNDGLALRRELLRNYPQTFHTAKLNTATTKKADPETP